MMRLHVALPAILAALLAAWTTISGASAQSPTNALTFDATRYTTVHISVDGAPMDVRRYHVVYVAKPVKMAAVQPARSGGPGGPGGRGRGGSDGPGRMGPPNGAPTAEGVARGRGNGPANATTTADPYAYQSMYIYVPQSAYDDTKTAIILQVNNGGWFASPAQDRVVEGGAFAGTNDTDNTGAALKAGYVIVSAGTRSRGIKADDDSWAGKAPAVVVDAKAAVRYLRLNDTVMAGSAERIIITGTSGGGALAVAVAASGNSPDYFPYLAAIGAAGIDAAGKSAIRWPGRRPSNLLTSPRVLSRPAYAALTANNVPSCIIAVTAKIPKRVNGSGMKAAGHLGGNAFFDALLEVDVFARPDRITDDAYLTWFTLMLGKPPLGGQIYDTLRPCGRQRDSVTAVA